MLKPTLILKDFKLNWEEEERERLITTQEKDWLFKTKINITLLNIDLLSESPTLKWFVKSSMPLLSEIKSYAKPALKS